MRNIVRPSIHQLEQYRRHGIIRIDLGRDCMNCFIDSNITLDKIPPKEGFIDGSYLKGAIGFWTKGGKNFERLLVFSEECKKGCLPCMSVVAIKLGRRLKGFNYFLKEKENIYIPIYEA